MKNKLIHFFRIDRDGSYHEFKLIHYLSIKSFAVCNPECNINIWINRDIISPWFNLLQLELGSRLKVCNINLSEDDFEKYDCVSHLVDCLKVSVCNDHGGLIIDTDYICIKPIDDLFKDDLVISEERDPLSHKYTQLALGFLYSTTSNKFLKDWINILNNYEKGKGWTYWAGEVPNELYKSDKYKLTVLPEALTDPYTYTRDRLADLFLHNRHIEGSYMFHTAESIAWDRFLKPLDLEHIMTVDTTFTKAVRKYVNHLWDSSTNLPKINY